MRHRLFLAWAVVFLCAVDAFAQFAPIPVTVGAGTNNIGDIDVLTLPAIPAGTNNIGDIDILSLPAPSAAAGDAIPDCVIVSAASTNATSCATAVANFFGYELFNTTTTVYYLRLYNLASAPTCSSATGFIRSIPIPPAGAAGQVGGAIVQYIVPKNYTTGLGFCITAGSSSTDNTNAAVGIFGALKYKQ